MTLKLYNVLDKVSGKEELSMTPLIPNNMQSIKNKRVHLLKQRAFIVECNPYLLRPHG